MPDPISPSREELSSRDQEVITPREAGRLDEAGALRIRRDLPYAPKDKHGCHDYTPMSPEQGARNRPYFQRDPSRQGVPDEI